MAKVDFSGNTITSPRWAGDFGGREHIMPFPAKLDAAQFNKTDAVVVTVGVAGAAADATSVPVAALTDAIPSGTTLHFGGKKFATLTATAAKGATSLVVSALATALVSADKATYPGSATAKKTVLSGTLVGRTYTERDANANWGPGETTDDELYLTYFDVSDADENAEVELYRPGSIVKENYLPNWSSLASGIKTKIRTLYQCITGTD